MTSTQQDPNPSAIRRFAAFYREHRLLCAGIGAALVLVMVLAFIRHRNAPAERAGQGRMGANGSIAVAVATVSSGDIHVTIPALGTITPLATVTVKSQISGQLQKIGFSEGQLVHKGDFLAQIDPRPYQAALEQAQANLARDEALLANARLDLERYQGLFKEDSIAEQQVTTQATLVNQYKGTVAADRAQVDTAQLNLQYTHIVSPVGGRVGLRQVDVGNYVTPGDTNGIVVVTQLEPISAVFAVPENAVESVLRPWHAGKPLQAVAFDRDNTSQLAVGKLTSVDNQIDPATGTLKLRAQFDNKDGTLFPNQFVNIRLLVDVLHDQVVIPNAAAYQGAPDGVASAFVYLVDTDRTVSVRPVTLGIVDGERIAVTAGLKPGDIVVTEGGDRLRDGAHVTIPAETAPSTGPANATNGDASKNGSKRRRRHADSSASGAS